MYEYLSIIYYPTHALELFIATISSENINIATGVFGPIASVFIIISGILMALNKSEASDIFYKSILIAAYFYFIQNYELITAGLLDFFSTAGFLAGGSDLDSDFLYDPARILIKGFILSIDVAIPENWLEWLEVIDNVYRLLTSLIVWLCFGFIAVSDFFIMIEYHVVVTLLVIVFPFGIIPGFSFISESVISTLFRMNIKVMTFSFAVSLIIDLLESEIIDKLSDNPSMEECLVVFLCVIMTCYVVWKVPNIASTIITGNPTFGAQGIYRATFSMISRTVTTAVSRGMALLK